MDKKVIWNARQREYDFLNSSQGAEKLNCLQLLLSELISGWPRRGRSVLVMNPVHPVFALSLWEAGFDITVQEECPELRQFLKSTLGHRATFTADFSDRLSFEDHSFDYAVIVGALPYWENQEESFKEVKRVVCKGAIFILVNYNTVNAIGKKSSAILSSLALRRELQGVFSPSKLQWRSVFMLPEAIKKVPYMREKAQSLLLPIPFGSGSGVRMDFGNLPSVTSLLIGRPDTAKIQAGGALKARGNCRHLEQKKL